MRNYTPVGREVLSSKDTTLARNQWRQDLDTIKAINCAAVPANCMNVKQKVTQADLLECAKLLEGHGHEAVNIVCHPDRNKKDGISALTPLKVLETVLCPQFVVYVLASPDRLGTLDKDTPAVTDEHAITRILVS